MYKIRWSAEAKADVKKIYDFTKNKSEFNDVLALV